LTADQPSPINPPSGCRFRTRCKYVMEVCIQVEPPLLQADPRRFVACHLYGGSQQPNGVGNIAAMPGVQPAPVAPSSNGLLA
jgi:oligopeptide transport system ATP-binding protein